MYWQNKRRYRCSHNAQLHLESSSEGNSVQVHIFSTKLGSAAPIVMRCAITNNVTHIRRCRKVITPNAVYGIARNAAENLVSNTNTCFSQQGSTISGIIGDLRHFTPEISVPEMKAQGVILPPHKI
jgi:hypothetical protein